MMRQDEKIYIYLCQNNSQSAKKKHKLTIQYEGLEIFLKSEQWVVFK